SGRGGRGGKQWGAPTLARRRGMSLRTGLSRPIPRRARGLGGPASQGPVRAPLARSRSSLRSPAPPPSRPRPAPAFEALATPTRSSLRSTRRAKAHTLATDAASALVIPRPQPEVLGPRIRHERQRLRDIEPRVQDQVGHRADQAASRHLRHERSATVSIAVVPDFNPLHGSYPSWPLILVRWPPIMAAAAV